MESSLFFKGENRPKLIAKLLQRNRILLFRQYSIVESLIVLNRDCIYSMDNTKSNKNFKNHSSQNPQNQKYPLNQNIKIDVS